MHQQYSADIEASVSEALATVDPAPSYMRYGENAWAGVKAHLDTITDRAAVPIRRPGRAAQCAYCPR